MVKIFEEVFLKTLEFPWNSCEIDIKLTRSENCFYLMQL